jgi:hypothetical protein
MRESDKGLFLICKDMSYVWCAGWLIVTQQKDEKCNARNNKIRCSGQVEHKEISATLQME